MPLWQVSLLSVLLGITSAQLIRSAPLLIETDVQQGGQMGWWASPVNKKLPSKAITGSFMDLGAKKVLEVKRLGWWARPLLESNATHTASLVAVSADGTATSSQRKCPWCDGHSGATKGGAGRDWNTGKTQNDCPWCNGGSGQTDNSNGECPWCSFGDSDDAGDGGSMNHGDGGRGGGGRDWQVDDGNNCPWCNGGSGMKDNSNGDCPYCPKPSPTPHPAPEPRGGDDSDCGAVYTGEKCGEAQTGWSCPPDSGCPGGKCTGDWQAFVREHNIYRCMHDVSPVVWSEPV